MNYKRFCATMLYVWKADKAGIVKYTGRMHKMRLCLCFYYIWKFKDEEEICSGEEKEESTGWKRRS